MANPLMKKAEAQEKIQELKKEEEELLQGAFSQEDAQRQQEINKQIEQVAEETGLDPSQFGPAGADDEEPQTVGIETGVTQEQVETGESQVIEARDENKETQVNTERQQEFVQESEAQEFKVTRDGERQTLSRQETLNRLQQRETKAERNLRQAQNTLEQLRAREQQERRRNRGGITPRPVEAERVREESSTNSFREQAKDRLRDLRAGGLELMETGQRFSEFATDTERVGTEILRGIGDRLDAETASDRVVSQFQEISPENLGQTSSAATSLATVEDVAGIATDRDITKEDAVEIGKTLSPVTTEEERDVQMSFNRGAGTAGTQAGGFFTAGLSGLGILGVEATEDPVQAVKDLGEGTAQFFTATRSQASKNPSGFISSEIGEEFGEAAVGAAILGPVGAAAGSLPTPDVTPEIEPARTGVNFVRGDLGSRATETNVIRKPFEELGPAGQTTVEQVGESAVDVKGKNVFRLQDDGTRVQQAVKVDTEQDTLTLGQRTEEQLTRRQFLKERLGLEEREVSDFLESNVIGSGTGAFLPPETEIEPETQIEPETENLFVDTPPESAQFDPLTIGKPQSIEPGVRDQIRNQDRGQQGQELDFLEDMERQEIEDQIDVEIPGITQRLEVTPEVTTETQQEQELTREIRTDVLAEQTLERPATPITLFGDERETDEPVFNEEETSERGFKFAPSLDAIISGQTITEEQAREQGLLDETFSGLETRPLIIKENGAEENVENLF